MDEMKLDPRYVQIRKREAAEIIGVSLTEFDRLRNSDPDFPVAYKHGTRRNSPVTFRLSDIYRYSEIRMSRAERVLT